MCFPPPPQEPQQQTLKRHNLAHNTLFRNEAAVHAASWHNAQYLEDGLHSNHANHVVKIIIHGAAYMHSVHGPSHTKWVVSYKCLVQDNTRLTRWGEYSIKASLFNTHVFCPSKRFCGHGSKPSLDAVCTVYRTATEGTRGTYHMSHKHMIPRDSSDDKPHIVLHANHRLRVLHKPWSDLWLYPHPPFPLPPPIHAHVRLHHTVGLICQRGWEVINALSP